MGNVGTRQWYDVLVFYIIILAGAKALNQSPIAITHHQLSVVYRIAWPWVEFNINALRK